MYLVVADENEFLQAIKEYMNDIFRPLAKDKEYVVLDQAIPANYSGYATRYFEAVKVVNIERDVRDVYIHLITQEKRDGAIIGHIGPELNKTRNVDMFVDWFKKYRRLGLPGESLEIRFEDLVFCYDETTKKILEYLDLPKEHHTMMRKYLQVEKSRKNIGLWKDYPNQDEIRQIEAKLPEYVYNEKYL